MFHCKGGFGSRCVFSTWQRVAYPDQKRPNPPTINMSSLNPKRWLNRTSPGAQHASPSFPLSLSFNTSLSQLPSCPALWILIPACHVFFPSPDPCCASSNYHSTKKTLSFKGLAIISENTMKLFPLWRKGMFEPVRCRMLCRLALEAGERRWSQGNGLCRCFSFSHAQICDYHKEAGIQRGSSVRHLLLWFVPCCKVTGWPVPGRYAALG